MYHNNHNNNNIQHHSQNNNNGIGSGGLQELILSPQKLAFDSETNLEKQFNSFEYTTHKSNKLKDLLHYQFTYEPNYFEMPNRINYKANKIDLVAEEFLPSVKMDTKVIKKIQSMLKDELNKQFFLNGNSFESSSHDLVHQTFYLDKVSFDFEDSFEKIFYGRQEYSLACFCIGDSSRPIKPSKIIQEQLKEAIKGISNFQGIDESDIQEYQYRRTDLLYLNHFRMFLFFESSNNHSKESYKIHRYLYYPRINFSAQHISQPFRLVSTPIAAFLTQKSKNSNLTQKDINQRKNLVKYGFLSLDRNSRMIPLNASDNYCVQIPLVGVWTYGIEFGDDDQPEHCDRRFIWSLLAEFVKNKTLAQRFTYNQSLKSFILAVFNFDRSAKYYEICITENMDDDILLEQTQNQRLNESNIQSINRQWCMIKNYSMSQDQSQQSILNNYNSHSEIASKLPLEYPFRYSPKMIVNYFDDDEFLKTAMKQSTIMKESIVLPGKQIQVNQNNQGQTQNKQTIKKNDVKPQSNHKSKQSLQKTVVNNNQYYNNNTNVTNNDDDSNDIIENNNHNNNKKNNNTNKSSSNLKNQILELQKQENYFLESQKSAQSASFPNNQTFSQNLQNQNQSSGESKSVEAGLVQDAQKIIMQQQEQINKMSQQIQELQEALKSFQVNQQQTSQSQIFTNQNQFQYPLSPQSQSQILQSPTSQLGFAHNRGQNNHPMMKNFVGHPQMPPPHPYYYDQYSYYPHPMTPHQYPAHPYPPMQDHPFNMYHRAPYYMRESYVSGDGKSMRGGPFNHFQVDAISDIQSIKKEDDVCSEISQQIIYNNFHAQLKQANNMMQPPQEEQLSFAQNNNNIFQNNLTARANNEQQQQQQQQQFQQQQHQIPIQNQVNSSDQTLQIMQQTSFQSLNNQSLQDQPNYLTNKSHSKQDSLTNQIAKQNNSLGNNSEQNHSKDLKTVQESFRPTGRISETNTKQNQQEQQYFNDSQQYENSRNSNYESQNDKYPQYTPHMYYTQEQQKIDNTKQMHSESVQPIRPSIEKQLIHNHSNSNQSKEYNQDYNDQQYTQQSSHKNIPQNNDKESGEPKNNRQHSFSNNNNIQQAEENKKQIKYAMENIMSNIESDETFTIDAKANYKINLDFLNSVRKLEDNPTANNNNGNHTNHSINNKENKNNLNKVVSNKSKPPTYSTLSPSALNSSTNKDVKGKIPTIKYENYCDSDSSDDEVKKIEKKYLNCL